MNKIALMKIGFFLVVIFSSFSIGKTYTVSNVTDFRSALYDAAFNGEDDTIYLQPGIYKTSSDGVGTFSYYDNEAHSLTIIGSEKETVILDGDNIDRVFSYNNEEGTGLILKNIIIQNGKIEGILEQGGGVYINVKKKAEINHCIFKNNYSNGSGGALDIDHAELVIVKNSSFIGNKTEQFGAAIYGGNYSKLIVFNTIFKNNSSIHGSAIANNGKAIIIHSTFYHNGYNINSTNPLLQLVGNTSGNTVKISNGFLINNIFAQNKYDLWIDEAISENYKVKIYNNYLSKNKIRVIGHAKIISKNIVEATISGDIKFINDSLQIASDSPARNKGMNIYSNEFKQLILEQKNISSNDLKKMLDELQYDKNGKLRDESPDLGAYEYGKNAKNESFDNFYSLELNSSSSSSLDSGETNINPSLSLLLILISKIKSIFL